MTVHPFGLSFSKFAELHGVGRGTVTKWRQNGYLVLTPSGLVDVAASNKKLNERPLVRRRATKGHTDGGEFNNFASNPAPGESEEITTAEANRRKELALAQLRELELAEKSGRLVDIADLSVNGATSCLRRAVGCWRSPRVAALSLPLNLTAHFQRFQSLQQVNANVCVQEEMPWVSQGRPDCFACNHVYTLRVICTLSQNGGHLSVEDLS